VQEALSPGSRVGRYRVEQVVARGGMGVVYRALDVGLERAVALKVIAPEIAREPGFRERFIRESRLAAGIDHPNVIPVYEAGEEDGTLFIAMRFVEGRDLREIIALEGQLDAVRAVELVRQVAAALDAAHARGLVHRDVKPANVLISRDGHAYLTDFGVAKREEATGLTQTGQMVGTVDYAAPEQIAGEAVDARTDVYALGCLLYASLAGDVPFRRSSAAATMMAHLRDAPPALDGVPPELGSVVGRALAKRADDRYGSAGEFARAASAAAAGSSGAGPARPPVAPVDVPGAAPTEPLSRGAPPPTAPHPPPTAPLPAGGGTPPTAPAPSGGGAPPAAPPPGPAGPAAGAPTAIPATRRRRRWPVFAALLAALAVGAVVAVVLLSGDDGGDSAGGDPTTSSPTRPTTTAAPSAGEPVSRPEADDVVRRYIAAYEAEDVDALGELFAPDVVQRSSTGAENRGKDAVLADYGLQFQIADDPEYTFTPGTFAERPAPSRLTGRYSVETSIGGPSGEIEFGIAKIDGTPLITEITTSSG
jgi:predicted Ser/Thr protein kinase